jgi:hypothetical protein
MATLVIFTKYSGTEASLQHHDLAASPDSVAVVEAEVEGVESVDLIKIRAPVLSATGVGSVTITMANDNSYFPNALEVVVVAVAVAVGMVVVVEVVDVVAVAVGVYVNSTILPRAANLAQTAPNAMAEFSYSFILSIDGGGLGK